MYGAVRAIFLSVGTLKALSYPLPTISYLPRSGSFGSKSGTPITLKSGLLKVGLLWHSKHLVLRDLKRLNIEVVLGDIPEPKQAKVSRSDLAAKKFGIVVNEIPDTNNQGKSLVVISNVAKGSNNSKIFLKGDIILEINRKEVDTIESFNSIIKSINKGDNCLFLIQRKSRDSEVTLYKSIKSN